MKFSLWRLTILVTLVAIGIRLRGRVENWLLIYAGMLAIYVAYLWYFRSPNSPIWFFGRLAARHHRRPWLMGFLRIFSGKAIACGMLYEAHNLVNAADKDNQVAAHEEAIRMLTVEIGRVPLSAALHSHRAAYHCWLGNYETAIQDASEGIRLAPNDGEAYAIRGYAYAGLGKQKKSLDDLELCEFTDSRDTWYAYHRGMLYRQIGAWDRARDDFELAYKLDAANHESVLALSTIQSGCPDSQLRDGKKALENASRIALIREWSDWSSLSCVASAHAELGNFEQAVEFAERTLELAPELESAGRRERLAQFKKGQPYRIEIEELVDGED